VSNAVKTHQPCPSCGSSDAYSLYDDGHGFCFSCSEYFPNENRFDTKYSSQSMPDWRGINAATFKYYGVTADVLADGQIRSVSFPYQSGGRKVRLFGEKAFYTIGEVKGLFGRERFAPGSHQSIVICEGELDALSIYQTTRIPCVSVRGASSGYNDARADQQWLDSFSRIYLAFDDDGPGQELVKQCARLFDYNKVYHVRMRPHKDANDFLRVGQANELATVIKNAKRYLPDTIVSSFSDFKEILSSTTDKGIAYPFPTLSDMTLGLRRGESVLITAQEGIGKTEFMHAIEYQLLRETSDPVAAIYLEEPKKRHLQAIAGLHVKHPVHLPSEDWTSDKVYRALQEAVAVDDRLHLYSHYGSDDPDSLLSTIRFCVTARECCWVLLDHITMAVSGVQGLEDERRKLDYLSTQLEMMVKELLFGLIMVSHVNDFGQTRGSRYISKIADIRIDLTRELNHPDELTRNTTMLNVSKNRFSGRTGPAGKLLFDTKTFTFSELLEADNDNTNMGRPVLLAV
jgi:twinkle protein